MNCKKMSDQNRTKLNKKQIKNREKFEQKRKKERIYSTLFAPYEPAAVYSINFINKNTTEAELANYKTMIEEMSWCICDTEGDRNTNKGALIQLMIPNKDEHSFMVFLIEMRQIEEFPKPQFVIVKQMLHHLFTSSIIMFIWGFLKAELQYFVNHSMIPFQTKVQEVNLQAIFKKWFDYALGINPSPIKQFSQSIVAQLVSHDSLNQMKKSKNNEWSLQDAVIYTLHKYLSKKETRQNWSQGLEGLSMEQQLLVKYATFDCLSMFDLMMFIYRHYQSNQQQQQQQTTEEMKNFFLKWQQEVGVVKKVKNVVQVLVEELSEESESGHERNDRYTFQRYSSIDKGTTNTENETVASIMLLDDEIVLVNNPACNQQQVIEQVEQQQQQVKSNESPESEMNQHEEQVAEHTTSQVNQQITTTTTTERKRKRKNKRSTEAKQRRNQKSSIRHRKNRYRFEVIRSLNMDVGSAKRILGDMNISVENINPVGTYLYISVKSEQQQNELDQLLPMDIFE